MHTFALLLLIGVCSAAQDEVSPPNYELCARRLEVLRPYREGADSSGLEQALCSRAEYYLRDADKWYGAMASQNDALMRDFDSLFAKMSDAQIGTFAAAIVLHWDDLALRMAGEDDHTPVGTAAGNTSTDYGSFRRNALTILLTAESLFGAVSPLVPSAGEYLARRGSHAGYSMEVLGHVAAVVTAAGTPLDDYFAPLVARWTREYAAMASEHSGELFNSVLEKLSCMATIPHTRSVTLGMVFSVLYAEETDVKGVKQLVSYYRALDIERAAIFGFFWHLAGKETRRVVLSPLENPDAALLDQLNDSGNLTDVQWLRKFAIPQPRTLESTFMGRPYDDPVKVVLALAKLLSPHIQESLAHVSVVRNARLSNLGEEEQTDSRAVDAVLQWGYGLEMSRLFPAGRMAEHAAVAVRTNPARGADLLPALLRHAGYIDAFRAVESHDSMGRVLSLVVEESIDKLAEMVSSATSVPVLYIVLRILQQDNGIVTASSQGALPKTEDTRTKVARLCRKRISDLLGVDQSDPLFDLMPWGYSAWPATYAALSRAAAAHAAAVEGGRSGRAGDPDIQPASEERDHSGHGDVGESGGDKSSDSDANVDHGSDPPTEDVQTAALDERGPARQTNISSPLSLTLHAEQEHEPHITPNADAKAEGEPVADPTHPVDAAQEAHSVPNSGATAADSLNSGTQQIVDATQEPHSVPNSGATAADSLNSGTHQTVDAAQEAHSVPNSGAVPAEESRTGDATISRNNAAAPRLDSSDINLPPDTRPTLAELPADPDTDDAAETCEYSLHSPVLYGHHSRPANSTLSVHAVLLPLIGALALAAMATAYCVALRGNRREGDADDVLPQAAGAAGAAKGASA